MMDKDRAMTAAHARQSTSRGTVKMISPVLEDVIGMFVQRNPKCNTDALREVGELVAEFGLTATKLSPKARKRLIAQKAQLAKFIAEISAGSETARQALKLVAKGPTKVTQGKGLGKLLSADDGKTRIANYATPTKVEDWAGPLAGTTKLKRDFGIARSTLYNWQKQGAIIGLLVGVHKHAFPIEQFMDRRPVCGLGLVIEAIGEPRTAWLWLREPNPGLGGAAPLARLKAGATDEVIEMARSNFGA
jgi:hypothetical protein